MLDRITIFKLKFILNQVFIVLSLAALTLADHAPAPSYAPRPTYKEPKYENHPAAYEYSYTVQDDYAGVNFGQNEKRDGYVTSGQYHVALPDCRIQTVTSLLMVMVVTLLMFHTVENPVNLNTMLPSPPTMPNLPLTMPQDPLTSLPQNPLTSLLLKDMQEIRLW